MKEGADLAVIEGVMGYYDGLGGVSVRGSSYELSVQTGTPVILVVNGRGMSLSIAALIRGFMDMYPDQMIRGVILNRVSKGVCERLTPIIEEKLGIAVVGYVRNRGDLFSKPSSGTDYAGGNCVPSGTNSEICKFVGRNIGY